MKLSQSLLLKLARKYEPLSMVGLRHNGRDLAVKTDADGNPVVLFIGKAAADGRIRGKRYTRTLKADARGYVIKDHWDLKGNSN